MCACVCIAFRLLEQELKNITLYHMMVCVCVCVCVCFNRLMVAVSLVLLLTS